MGTKLVLGSEGGGRLALAFQGLEVCLGEGQQTGVVGLTVSYRDWLKGTVF